MLSLVCLCLTSAELSLEGPACQVRRTTLDNPSRFSGHDKRAPPKRHDKRAPLIHLCRRVNNSVAQMLTRWVPQTAVGP